ncbi:MAG: cytochrome c oxidase assembly protein, partial [Pseudoxanthomonas sp.]|nr:cytochrome c oxidase assembly protein [Pseudoxanthomonas sp.]
PRPLYPVYVERAPMLGLDALADQQLAGLVMWIPSALPYLAGGLWLAVLGLRWLDRDAAPGQRP